MIPIGHQVIDVCPHCKKECLAQKMQTKEVYEFKGKQVEIMVRYLVCQRCKQHFNDLTDPFDAEAEIQKEYKKKWPPSKKS